VCGIAGIVRADGGSVTEAALRRMAAAQRHRGPDGYGIATGPGVGLVSTRLAIFDVPGGWQPMRGPAGTTLVYNGEVFNHPELRAELERDGERFATTCDSEVVLRLLEREGTAALHRLNGQFALAWWDPGPRRLTLVRDRFGVRPLHHAALPGRGLAFASEAKGLFASGEVSPAPDMAGIDQVFQLWAPRPPRTAFAGVSQLAPGSLLVWEDGRVLEERRWWSPEDAADDSELPLADLLRDAVALRLRADVPVGAYLSGGLDSSLTSALARELVGDRLRTFSVAFHDPAYDERPFQEDVARRLGTEHHVLETGPQQIADAFPAVVRSCETPLIRTAPVPLWLLAETTRAQGITVVITGEGADELFWGYDLFKEVALRELHARDPQRAEALVDRLYPELAGAGRRGPAWRRFLLDAAPVDDPLGSHRTRLAATAAVRGLYRDEMAAAIAGDPLADLLLDLPAGFAGWPPLERAARLELGTLLGDHLLAAQGDRVAMAHGVEGRFPFLDPRVHARAAALPPEQKLDGLHDKVALRDIAAGLLEPEIAERRKQPYRAPGVAPFFGDHAPGWVSERLSAAELARVGIFDPARVEGLLRRCRAGRADRPRESMALVGVASTQVWHDELCHAGSWPEERSAPRVHLTEPVVAARGAA
jgi:asparagine synthase (glutamine-hydrolysing)